MVVDVRGVAARKVLWGVEIARYCRLELALLPVLWLLRDRVEVVLERHGKQGRGAGGSAVVLSCLVQLAAAGDMQCCSRRGTCPGASGGLSDTVRLLCGCTDRRGALMPAAAGRQSNQMGPSRRGGDPPAIKIGERGGRPRLDTLTQMLGNAACWAS